MDHYSTTGAEKASEFLRMILRALRMRDSPPPYLGSAWGSRRRSGAVGGRILPYSCSTYHISRISIPRSYIRLHSRAARAADANVVCFIPAKVINQADSHMPPKSRWKDSESEQIRSTSTQNVPRISLNSPSWG